MVEIVDGIIIGDLGTAKYGKLYHNGKSQSPFFHADTDAGIRDLALRFIDNLKNDLGPEYHRLYPIGMELRIWDN